MSSLFNQYRRKRKELTVDMIDELTDRLELINAEKINKISLSTQAQKEKLEEKNIIDVEIEKETYNIIIAKRAKSLMRKRKIPLKIMNNENTMENKKAGFVATPFSSNQQKEDIEENIYLKLWDYDRVKKQIQEYKENDMGKDLEILIKKADEVGGVAKETVDEILRDLGVVLEDFQDK